AAGDDRLTGTRYDWVGNPAAMEPADRRAFAELRRSGLKTARACHLDEDCTGNPHEIPLPRCTANPFCAEAGYIKLARDAGGHLHVTAREPEVKGPHGILATPLDQILEPREDYAAAYGLFQRLRVGSGDEPCNVRLGE